MKTPQYLLYDVYLCFPTTWGQGIFLSPLEEQSSLLFNYVFKMFSVGAASLPEGGMGEVPKQIADDLPEGTARRQYFAGHVERVHANSGLPPPCKVHTSGKNTIGRYLLCWTAVVLSMQEFMLSSVSGEL